MSPDADAIAVLSCYRLDQPDPPAVALESLAGPASRLEPLENAGGFSGSRLWKVTTADGRAFCLRRWPGEHPSPERLRFIHDVLREVAAHLPIVAAPIAAAAGGSFVEHAGHRWELTRWLPGQANYRAQPTPVRLRAAMHSLARFHRLAAAQGRHAGVPRAFVDRLQRHAELRGGELAAIWQALGSPLGNDIDCWARRLFTLASQRLAAAENWEKVARPPRHWLQPAIRDIHHDHVLFTGDEVTGLVDFGALRIDTPLADIARLVGSLAGDDPPARRLALDAYAEILLLGEHDRQLVEWLDQTGIVLGTLNWLSWLYVERRDMGPIAPIVRRLAELSNRLQHQAAR
jgi:homoserine kinase type II